MATKLVAILAVLGLVGCGVGVDEPELQLGMSSAGLTQTAPSAPAVATPPSGEKAPIPRPSVALTTDDNGLPMDPVPDFNAKTMEPTEFNGPSLPGLGLVPPMPGNAPGMPRR